MIKILKGPPGSILTTSIQWDSSWPELAKDDERHNLFSYMENRFGIPEKQFDNYLLFKRKKTWWLMKNAPHVTAATEIKVSKVGLRAFQKVGAFIKPTTRMIQIFGPAATKARLEIDEKQLLKLLAGEVLSMNLDLDKGYVILGLKGNRILGLGFFINRMMRSQIPKKELRSSMLRV